MMVRAEVKVVIKLRHLISIFVVDEKNMKEVDYKFIKISLNLKFISCHY